MNTKDESASTVSNQKLGGRRADAGSLLNSFKKGDFVQTWFDTGAMVASIIYGVVTKAGPKTFYVRWESGISNRIRQDSCLVKLAKDQEEAGKACRYQIPEERPW